MRALLCLGVIAGLAAGEAPALFPDLAEVPAPLCMPAEAPVQSDADGTWLVEGRPRFLVGAQITNTTRASMAPTSGYPAALAWLYEQPLDWGASQRLGIDSWGFFTADAWLRTRRPGYVSHHHAPGDEAFLAGWLQAARLPVYVDFSCFPWSHGALARQVGALPPEALNRGGWDGERNHWVPYSATHPAGRELYRAMWEAGVRQVRDLGLRPLYYELFNEPAYDDPSPYNLDLFAQALAARFTDVAALNRAWRTDFADVAAAARGDRRRCRPLAVAWGRFMEDGFTALVAEGVRTLRAGDPQARSTVQIMGGSRWRELALTNVNLQRLVPMLDVVSTPTGGGIVGLEGGLDRLPARAVDTPDPDPRLVEGLLMRRYLAAIAAGKPVVDGEMYTQVDAGTTVAAFWLQAARGGNAAYLFEWGRRSWDADWTPAGSEAGGRRVAAKFPWYLLNPYAVPPEVLTAPMTFKREFARAGAAFVSRARGVAPRVALLHSTATERYALAAGGIEHHQVRTWAAALAFAHHEWSVVTEEQLATGALPAVAAIIAPAVRNVLPTTPDRLRTFVAAGGTLIAGNGVLGEDEEGAAIPRAGLVDLDPGQGDLPAAPVQGDLPVPPGLAGAVSAQAARGLRADAAWRVRARAGADPLLLERPAGAGRVVYLGGRLGAYPLAALLGGVLAESGVASACLLRREDGELAVNVEVHASRLGGGSTWLLANLNQVPLVVRLRPDGAPVREAADLIAGRRLPVRDGEALVALPAHRVVVVACDAGHADLPAVAPEALRAEIAAAAEQQAVERARRRSAEGIDDPPVDQARTATIDLRPFANRHFIDGVAGDGEGGWTDQGANNSLQGVPFGRQVWRGMPWDIIRFDENANRTCIVLASPRMAGGAARVAGIPVGAPVGALHLLLASAWSQTGVEAGRLVVRYQDGGERRVPIRCGIEVGDWWLYRPLNRTSAMQAVVAFRNVDDRGLFAWTWENPEPGRAVADLALESSGNDPILVVAGITRSDPAPRLDLLAGGGWTAAAFNGARAALADARLVLVPGGRGWSGGSWSGPAVALPDGLAADGRLDLAVAGLAPDGGEVPLPVFKLRLHARDAQGRVVAGPWWQPAPAADRSAVRRRPWQSLAALLPPASVAVERIEVQFVGDVPPGAGLAIARLRLTR